eukprot:828975-Alexandrium_andersonii.AAC.1
MRKPKATRREAAGRARAKRETDFSRGRAAGTSVASALAGMSGRSFNTQVEHLREHVRRVHHSAASGS